MSMLMFLVSVFAAILLFLAIAVLVVILVIVIITGGKTIIKVIKGESLDAFHEH